MSLHIVVILLAGVCGVAALIDSHPRPWAGLGVLLLAIALVL